MCDKDNTIVSLDPSDILSCDGPLSRYLPNFEVRPQQVDMARDVQEALRNGRHLVVEAGTGIGKSFAYLLPLIQWICQGWGPVIVSTYTINLQEQLLDKDIPVLTACLEQPFKAVLAKGRNHYLCRRRLAFSLKHQRWLFDQWISELRAIAEWAARTGEGSLSDLDFLPNGAVWDRVKSEHGNCRARRCPYFNDCFYVRARRQLDCADIIVANHALLFSDLVLKQEGHGLLPDFTAVVLDEAHTLERVAEDHFGIHISRSRVQYILNGLYHARRRRGLLTSLKAHQAIDMVCQLHIQTRAFFDQILAWYGHHKDDTQGRCHKHIVDDILSPDLKTLRRALRKLARTLEDEDHKYELNRYVDLVGTLIQDLECFLNQTFSEHVYWVETDQAPPMRLCLRSAPLHVGPDVRRCLFDIYDKVILTSATLSTVGPSTRAADNNGFDYFTGRIGLRNYQAVKRGSPFRYDRQVTLYVERDLPDPNAPEFIKAGAETLKKYLLYTQGRAFVLFTSYSMLTQMAKVLRPWLEDQGMVLCQQGDTMDRSALLNIFKSEGSPVLFGTDSFWQGVDVPGQILCNVIIVRLPFSVPDQPLLAGRLEHIQEQGGHPFYDYQLPAAIIKFKQGFGRLIRNKTDHGIVVVLDSRIATKTYGRCFLEAIPQCTINIVSAHGDMRASLSS
jgi:ATP-dependent DNA helicase DinG